MEKTIKINFGKNIGTVIYFVEGENTEFTLLKTVFGKILHYDYVEKKRGKAAKFINNQCPYSKVYVINTSQSNITDISDVDFLDQMFENLINEYGLDADNAAKFYLFDRDNQSNTDTKAIECFVLSNFIENTYEHLFKLGRDVKSFMGEERNQKTIQFNKITDKTLVHASEEILKYIKYIGEQLDLENISELNKAIYIREERLFEVLEKYNAVSEVILSLLYLGILEIEEK